MPRSSAAKAIEQEPVSQSSVYVHLMSGEVAVINPATNVHVQSNIVVVYNGVMAVASYPRKDVFSCSLQETSPAFT